VLADAKIPTGEEFHPEPEVSAITDDLDPPGKTLLRVPRGSRVFIPEVGFPAPPEKRKLRNDSAITFQAEHLCNVKHHDLDAHEASASVAAAADVGNAGDDQMAASVLLPHPASGPREPPAAPSGLGKNCVQANKLSGRVTAWGARRVTRHARLGARTPAFK